MLLDRAKDLYDAGKQKGGADPEQTAKRQSADGQGLYSDAQSQPLARSVL